MKIVTERLKKQTSGAGDLQDITAEITEAFGKTGLTQGLVNIFVVGSTAAITDFEYEPGLTDDIRALYERIAPRGKHYRHDDTWNDANGFSHVRAALQGPGLAVPFENNRLLLGTWQQIVLAEFDTRPRKREIILTFIGE